jgi:GR25 family glycosyltransferase involved in LPS biosynthesis
MLNNYFEKIYCINLSERTDRWNHVTNEFNKIGCSVERVEAVDGKRLPIVSNQINPGEVGAYLSHMNLLKYIIDNNIQTALIFEDDVIFCDDFNTKFKLFYNQLPEDKTLVYVSGNYSVYNNKVTIEKITENVYSTVGTLALHAYFLDLETAKKIHALLFERYPNEPVDDAFIAYHRLATTYVFKPNLVYQKPDYSNTRFGYRNYNDVFIN